jgi:tetratricopeptide (TPR) repeat protein
MLPLPLTIRYRELPQHEPVAWLVPGDDAALWMEEWLRWQLPQEEWWIAVLPGWGVLTLLAAKQTPVVPPRALPLGRVSPRVYVPLHAELIPSITTQELEDLLPADFAVAVFHPARGLLVVESREMRTVSELFEPPAFCALDWTAAQPGEALNERLLSVQPATTLSLAEVLEAGRGDIGSQGAQFGQLPARPNEPGSGALEQAGRSLMISLAKAVAQLANLFGPSKPPPKPAAGSAGQGAGSGWLRALSEWAARKLGGMTQQIEELRNKEILRLMHLLQSNPDEGLKYALPFGGEGQHRGVAPPSGRLGTRDVNFSLSRLGGGGPADVWNLPAQYQLQLAQRYRELANRELQLGRHRRAAYIFAELLADLDAAASALQAGEHWREAAVLYRDRLNRPLVAAGCLEKGGLLHEAIALYEPLREYEKIGDLYQRLEQRGDALQAWRAAAAMYEGKLDYLRAAKLMEEKIGEPEIATQMLDRSWLAGNRPRESLEKLFELFARYGWHDRTRARIKALRDELNTDTVALAGTEALTTVVRTYPDRSLIAYAADTARVLVGIHLPQAELNLRTKLVAALQALVPADQLLQRDGQRYLREQAAKPPASERVKPLSPPANRPKARGPQLVREFRLPEKTIWEAIASQGSLVYAIGNVDGRLDVRFGDWQGDFEPIFPEPHLRVLAGLIDLPQVAADPQNHGPLLVATGFGNRECSIPVTTPAGPRNLLLFHNTPHEHYARIGVCYALHRAFWIEHDQANGMLIAKGRTIQANQTLGEIATTFPLCPSHAGNVPIPTHGRNDLLAVGYSNQLLLVRGEDDIERLEFSGSILQITGSAPFTRPRLAVVTTEGTYVLWLQGRETSTVVRCAAELGIPVVCFTIGGRLAIIAANGGEVYESSGGHLTVHSQLPWHEQPLAVLPTDEPDQFAIFLASGLVRIFQIG